MPENENGGKNREPFKVTISDEDYMSPDELDELLSSREPSVPDFSYPAKQKFEVHFDEQEIQNYDPEETQPENRGEIYFSNVKPVRPPVSAQPAKKKKKKNGAKGAFALFLALLIILTSGLTAYALSCVEDILAFRRSDDTVTVTIPNEATTNDIIDILADNDLVHQRLFCKLYYRLFTTLKNLNKTNVKEPVYLSGVYYVEKNEGLETYLQDFREAQSGKDTVYVSIPEGWSIYQIFERLDKFGVCSKSRLLSSVRGTDFEYKFIKNIRNNQFRTFALEGYLYPNTYEFYVDSDPNSVLRKFFDEFEIKWTDEYQEQADKLGYTMDEIITIASIIQREAANQEQMADISSVIHNRLRHSTSWPTLGCDSTTTYVNSYIAPNVTSAEGNMYSQHYNTYTIQGLPPGPICNPGDDAINAALFPNDTNYYFFRHDKYGKIYLASTQAEHDYNANLVLRANNS